MVDNLVSIKRHLAKSVPITFKNEEGEEDTFMFKPLNIEQQALFMEISKNIECKKKIVVNGVEVPDVTKEDIMEVSSLFENIVKTSMPELDEATIKEFVNSNFEELFAKITVLLPKTQSSNALELIKQRQEASKSGTGSTESSS